MEFWAVECEQNGGCAHTRLVRGKSVLFEYTLGHLILKDEKLNILINNNYLTN